MNKISLIFFLFSIILCKEPYEKDGDVLVLNEQTFGTAIREFKYLFVLFFDPECPHCYSFMPIFGQMATDLKKENFVFAKLDSYKYEKIANNYDLEAFPTLILLKETTKYVFEGERSFEKIESFLKEKTKTNFIKLENKKDLEDLQKDNKAVVVYFGKSQKVIDEIVLADRVIDNVVFATTESDELIKENVKPENNESIVIFKQFDDKKNILKEEITAQNIINFCNLYSNPKVMEFNKDTSPLVFAKRNPSLVIFSSKNEKNYDENKKLLYNIWEHIQGKVKLFISDINDIISKSLAEFCGIKMNELPKAMIIDPSEENPKKYEVTGELNEENLKKFIDKFLKKELKPFIRSEEVPKDNNGDIYILVGKTFQKEVLENDKDVLVYFVSPWCRVCKQFEPKLAELSKKLKEKNPKLLIAKMDATLNDVEEYQIHNFPTTKFYPGNAKDKEPLNFYSRRNITSLYNFIKKKAFNKIIDDNEENKKTTDL